MREATHTICPECGGKLLSYPVKEAGGSDCYIRYYVCNGCKRVFTDSYSVDGCAIGLTFVKYWNETPLLPNRKAG